MPSAPEDLTTEDRTRLRRAHERLRTAAQEIMALVATEPIRKRWEPDAAPPEILDASRLELQAAWAELNRAYSELLGWEPPA